MATGGRSVPATGSTGFGLDLAAAPGHDLVATVAALAAPAAAPGVVDGALLACADTDPRTTLGTLLAGRGAGAAAA